MALACRRGVRTEEGTARKARIRLFFALCSSSQRPSSSISGISINPHFITYVAFFIAVDKGYFHDAGIDLQVSKYTTSANSQLPMLARGETIHPSKRAKKAAD